VKIAADANVLLSAILGGRARLVLEHPQIEAALTTDHTFSEVEEYAPILAVKKRLSPDRLLLAVAALGVTIVDRGQYAKSMAQAARLISHRDPEDIELLALALHLRIPIWSNDKDFDNLPVPRFSTEGMLRHLRIIG
jgi:predicted nucleic acid-binding protein